MKNSGTVWKVCGVLAVVALGAGVIANSVRIGTKQEATMRTLGASDYVRYLLDDETGKPTDETREAKDGLSTGDYLLIEGAKVTLEDGAEVHYQVNFYTADKTFLGVEDYNKNKAFDATDLPDEAEGAKYMKVEIIPDDDADGTVSILEKDAYAKQLKVEIKR